MGVYKVIQDIEAEDKLLGPLSLKQFIFAVVAVLFYYLSGLVIAKHAQFMLVLFLPIALFATFFAWPWSADQPTEVWALAKIRYFFKPRKRIWDQSGQKELVTITAPKKLAEPVRTNGLSQREVRSRLGALANTIDSRGWAIKNAAINLSTQQPLSGSASDRLVDPNGFTQEVPNYDVHAADDILDEQNNPIAQQFDQMINAATQTQRQKLVQMMNTPSAGMSLPAPVTMQPASMPQPAVASDAAADGSRHWFMNRPDGHGQRRRDQQDMNPGFMAAGSVPQSAAPTADEAALGRQFKTEHDQATDYSGRMKTVQPLDDAADGYGFAPPIQSDDQAQAVAPVQVPATDPAILQLAGNDDLDVATLARQAHKKDGSQHHEFGDNEVVISLH